MAQPKVVRGDQCPKCSAPIPADTIFTWCLPCGKRFPQEVKDVIVARNQKVQEDIARDAGL